MAGERSLPGLGLRGFYNDGSNGWGTKLSEDLRKLSAMSQLAVASRVTDIASIPPGGIIIVRTDDPTNPNKVAVNDTTGNVFFTPFEGMEAYVQDEDLFVRYDGSVWVQSGMFYDISVFVGAKPTASEVVFKMKAVRAFKLPAALTGSQGDAGVAATGSTAFSLRKNGTEFGTATFAAAGTVPTFAAASSTSFAIGDRFSIRGPATADGTIAEIALTLKGQLV